jgi:multicomponent Na+:H+ antiporter subunit A
VLAVVVLHLLLALAAPVLVTWLGRRALWVLALGPAAAAAYALSQTSAVLDGRYPVENTAWVPSLGLGLIFRLDPLSWLLLLVVGAVGALVLVYSSAYFSRDAAGMGRFAGVLVGFAGAMAGLVTSDNLLLLFVFWELTTVFSYLLIGHHAERKASRRAAMQAIVVTTAGGLAMLVGLVILGVGAGTWRISEILANPPSGGVITAAAMCLLAGAATKSAQVPTHFWLPAAMAAPTPVSAYLHAAAMVKAGIYLIARFAPAFSDLVGWRWGCGVLGSASRVLGGYGARRERDLKLVLAFGTVSQLGLLVLLLGYGTRAAALAGLALLGAHAMFKASLFLVVGVVDGATGTRDLRRLNGLGRHLPGTAVAGVLATASMIGLPPFAGYVAKEAALESLLHGGGARDIVVLVVVAIGSALTVAYGLRFVWGAFGWRRSAPAGQRGQPVLPAPVSGTATVATPSPAPHVVVQRPPRALGGPPRVLAVLGLVVAALPRWGEELLAPHADTYPAGEPGHLALWAGFTPTLAITAVVLAAGVGLFWQRKRVERLQDHLWSPLGADLVYRRFMRWLDELAADVTGGTQRGSLPSYLGTILVAVIVGPGLALAWGLRGATLPGAQAAGDGAFRLGPLALVPYDEPTQLVVVLVVAVAAILAVRARRRLKAVFLVGVTGYGNAVLFLLHGAPDLALTQVLTETVTLVVMVLVLRRLPPYFSDRPLAASRWVRVAIGVGVGLAMMLLVTAAPLARTLPPISTLFPEAALAGGGRNIVNVALVDLRAWDTVGEISVLLVAATGVASLVFLRQRSAPAPRVRDGSGPVLPPPPPPDAFRIRRRSWIWAGRTLEPERRSLLFEVITRVVFHAMVVFALFLLFRGHSSPGGGFAAGLVVGLALAVRYLAGGRYGLGEALPVHPGLILGTGLFLSAGVGLGSLLAGQHAIESFLVDLHLPVFGDVHLVTSLFFDLGVFLVVVGLVLDVLRSLGAEVDVQRDSDGAGFASFAGSLRGDVE